MSSMRVRFRELLERDAGRGTLALNCAPPCAECGGARCSSPILAKYNADFNEFEKKAGISAGPHDLKADEMRVGLGDHSKSANSVQRSAIT